MAAKQMPRVAKGMNASKKWVASTTLKPTWNNSHLLAGGLVESVRELKKSDGPGLTVLGSGEVVVALGDAGLIDEYQFVIVPVALGKGRTVFGKQRALRLIEQRAFPGGNVMVTYAV